MATNCTGADSIYSDICFAPGKKSLPGIRGHLYGISKRDILAWPTIGGEAPKTLAEVVKYSGDFKLASDKKWHKIALIPNEGQLQVESQGTYGSKTFKVTGNAVAPGTEEEISGYIAQANNDEMVYLFVQRNGKARVIGSEAFTPEPRCLKIRARLLPIPTRQPFRRLLMTSILLPSIPARLRPLTATSQVLRVCRSL